MKKVNYLPSLDGIRAICILLVLGAHAPLSDHFPYEWTDQWLYFFNGPLGVLTFFVLSGFLITFLLIREEENTSKISLKSFYARRIIRIFPIYYFFIFIIFLLDTITDLEMPDGNYLTMLTYTKNFGYISWIEGHLWSLSVEEQFYLIWPLIMVLFSTKGRWYFAFALILSAPIFRIWFYTQDLEVLYPFSFMTNMDSLMIGCITALLIKRYPEKLQQTVSWNPTLMRIAAVISIYLIWMLKKHFMAGIFTVPFGNTVQSVAAAYLIVSYVFHQQGIGYTFLNNRYVRYLGVLSYSIYIWQQIFFTNAKTFGFDSLLILTFPFNIFAAIAVAIVSYHVLEKPFLKLRKRYRNTGKSEELTIIKAKADLQTATM